jgi:tetratricopeptide (TPR) repeat protein
MSRFVNLELNGDSDYERRADATVKDEGHYLARANAALESAEWEMALRQFGKVLEFNPGNVSAWTGQVRMLIELGEHREARLWADKALEKFANHPELLAAKAVALARSGDLETALAFSDASVEDRGDSPYIWLARADVMLAREESRADFCFDRALMQEQNSWLVAWLAARIRVFYRQFALALKLLQRALELNSTHFLLWLELGQCQEALGLTGPATSSFEQASQLNPSCSQARLALGRVKHTSFFSALRRRLFP